MTPIYTAHILVIYVLGGPVHDPANVFPDAGSCWREADRINAGMRRLKSSVRAECEPRS